MSEADLELSSGHVMCLSSDVGRVNAALQECKCEHTIESLSTHMRNTQSNSKTIPGESCKCAGDSCQAPAIAVHGAVVECWHQIESTTPFSNDIYWEKKCAWCKPCYDALAASRLPAPLARSPWPAKKEAITNILRERLYRRLSRSASTVRAVGWRQ